MDYHKEVRFKIKKYQEQQRSLIMAYFVSQQNKGSIDISEIADVAGAADETNF